jgi:DoxX-like family
MVFRSYLCVHAIDPQSPVNQEITMTTETIATPSSSKLLGTVLWTVQGLLALFYLYGAYAKLVMPVDELSKMMPWTADHPALRTFTGLVDLTGGLGILLPGLTRIQPRLTVLAAAGMLALQTLAIGFHASRGEFPMLPVNVVLFALAAFVLWGRTRALSQ